MPIEETKILQALEKYELFFTQKKPDDVYSKGLEKLQPYLNKYLKAITLSEPNRRQLNNLKGKITALQGRVNDEQIATVISLITPYLDAPKGGSVPKSNSKPPNDDVSVPKDNSFDFDTVFTAIDYSAPVGIKNFTEKTGNNCSLISLIQVIFHTPELRQTFLLQKSKYQKALQNLVLQYVEKAQGKNVNLNVEELRLLFVEDGIFPKTQQDSREFLEKMVAEINIENLTNIWTEIVKYELENAIPFEKYETLISLNNTNEHERQNPIFFHDLMITNGQNLSLLKLFENFKNPPKLQNLELDQVESDLICKNGIVKLAAIKKRHYEIKKLTNLLAFSLIRINNHGEKITQAININKEFATGHKLQSFIIHIGSGSGGHYVSYIKQENDWFRCNDSSIEKISEEEALLNAKSAYLFFYYKSPSTESDKS